MNTKKAKLINLKGLYSRLSLHDGVDYLANDVWIPLTNLLLNRPAFDEFFLYNYCMINIIQQYLLIYLYSCI